MEASILMTAQFFMHRFAECEGRAGSKGKQTRLGVQGRSEVTVQFFKFCACPLDPLNLHSAI